MIVSHSSQSYRLESGQMFEGRYRILRELGSGGFGMVYLAHQEAMGRHVALKVLTPEPGSEEISAKARFLREVQIISKLRHPNTVTIHDFGETLHGVVYMVLEYIEGETLKDLLRREGAQDPVRALMLIRQVARSVAEAHRHGIVHRDLKPANIMLMNFESEKDVIKVLDFGVARLLNAADADLTSAGTPDGERALIGTPRYMSPEQVRGQSLSPASDIYSMGLLLYEMLIGEPAVQGDTTMSLIMQQISPEALQLPMLKSLPMELQRVVRQATEKKIELRYASATAFADDVEQLAMYLGTSGQRISAALPMPTLIRHATGNFSQSGLLQQTYSPDAQETMPHMAAFVPPASTNPPAPKQTHPQQIGLQSPGTPAHATAFAGHHQRKPDPADSFIGLAQADLPPPPLTTDNPFATEETPPENYADANAALNVVEEESLSDFSQQTALLIALIFLATLSTYFAFLYIGVLVNFFLDAGLKFIATIFITLAIPTLTILSEFSQNERFEVVIKPKDRIRRVALLTSMFGLLVVLLLSVLMPGSIINEFRGNPNWFLRSSNAVSSQPSKISTINRNISFTLADVVDSTTRAIGLYKPEPAKRADSAPAYIPGPPPSTRPGNPEKSPDDSTAPDPQSPQNTEAPIAPNAENQPDKADTTPPTKRRSSPIAPTRPKKDPDGDYVRW